MFCCEATPRGLMPRPVAGLWVHLLGAVVEDATTTCLSVGEEIQALGLHMSGFCRGSWFSKVVLETDTSNG